MNRVIGSRVTLLLLFVGPLVSLVAAAAWLHGRDSAEPGGELASQVLPASKGEVAAKGAFGEFRKLLAGETRSVKDLLTGVAVIEPGQEIHPPHRHVEEEFLLVVEGEGTWHLDGKESPARAGDLLYVAPDVVHGIKNTSTASKLTFVVVKWSGKETAEAAGAKKEEGAAGAETAEGAAAPASGRPAALVSQILHRADVAPDPAPPAPTPPIGDLRRYWSGAATSSLRDLVVGVATLHPGQQVHPPHRHAEEELLFVTKGRGTWTLGPKRDVGGAGGAGSADRAGGTSGAGGSGLDAPAMEFPAAAGDLLYTEPWVEHGLKNSSGEPLEFFIVKWNGRAGGPAKER